VLSQAVKKNVNLKTSYDSKVCFGLPVIFVAFLNRCRFLDGFLMHSWSFLCISRTVCFP